MDFPECRICLWAINFDKVQVGDKGQRTLIAASKRRGDGKFLVKEENMVLHGKCRAIYTNERSIICAEKNKMKPCTVPDTKISYPLPIPTSIAFDYQKHCLLCKKDASEDFIRSQVRKHQKDRIVVCRVKKESTAETIMRICLDDIMNEHYEEVRKRVHNKDLVTLNARYHKLCYVKFLNRRIITYGKRGRPASAEISQKMEFVYNYLDSIMDDTQFTIEELQKAVGVEIPGYKTLERRLIEHYGSNISVVKTVGKPFVFRLITTTKIKLENECVSILRFC